MQNSPVLLHADNLHKSFPVEDGGAPLVVLEDVSFQLHRAEIVSIIGSSGSGKSTLLHLLGGLDRPDEGTVYWGDQRIDHLKTDQLADLRNKEVGFVFQFHHLLPEFTALENTFMPSLIQGKPLNEVRERARHLLERFGIGDRASHRPTQLSGGEQQRVSLARALMNNPRIILADEPTGNLDAANTEVVLEMLFELREKDGVSIVMVTHEKDLTERSDRVYNLKRGKLYTLEKD